MTVRGFLLATTVLLCCSGNAVAQRNRDPESWKWVDDSPVNGLVHKKLHSRFMQRDLGVNIYLPPSYASKPGARYPVVYFLHGASGTERSDADISAVRRLIQAGKFPEAIFVFPNGGQYSRYRDWPDKNVKVESYFIRELIPYIDSQYRTIASRETRALSGWSMGGDASLRFATKYPELFSIAATFSAAIDWGADKDDSSIFNHSRENAAQIRDRVAFRMVVGEDDRLLASHKRLAPHWDELKIEYEFQTFPSVGHNLGKMKELAADSMLLFIAKHLERPSDGPVARKPVLLKESRQICSMPDLGSLNGPNIKRQHIVDHGFLNRDDGSWLLWACMRGTKPGRVLYGWEADNFEDAKWRPLGVVQRADSAWGEPTKPEAIQAPFFMRVDNQIRCFYNGAGIRSMNSKDGREFSRTGEPPNGNLLYGDGGRDVMVMRDDGRYYAYSTLSTREGKGYVVLRTSTDLQRWTPRKVVCSGGAAGSGPVSAESPYVVKLDGYYYLFRASSTDFKTYVYRSTDPEDFGQDDDSKLIATMPIKAPEVFAFNGQWFISDLADFQGIVLHRIDWKLE